MTYTSERDLQFAAEVNENTNGTEVDTFRMALGKNVYTEDRYEELLQMANESDDEYIDVDDSEPSKRLEADLSEADGKNGLSSGDDDLSVKSPDSGSKRGAEKKMYRCDHCKYVTDRKNNLKRHVITMHEQCQKTLECCEVIFKNKASLRDHVMSCHRNGYDCRICGRNFCRKALLKRHITVHSGQKDYICSVCGYATSHKSNLDRHKRRHEPKYPLDGAKYRFPDAMGVEGVQVLSPSSLSSSPNSPPSLSKCHAFSIERLVNNDYHPRRIYSDLAVATSPMTHTPTPPTTYFAAVNVLYPERRPQSTLPPKKRHHLSTRYLFTRRLTCTHPDNSPTNCFVEKCQTEDKSRCEKSSLFTPLNKLKNGRRNGIPKRNLVMVSSKRLVPTLYQCKVCDIVFENQVEMGDHFNRVRHEQWTPGPQRPLTLLARGTDARYVPIL